MSSISAFVKEKALAAGSWTQGSWQWSYEGSKPHAKIGYEANLIDPDAAWLRLPTRQVVPQWTTVLVS